MLEPPRESYTEMVGPQGVLEFDSVGAVKAALDQHDSGQFRVSAFFADSMLRDDRIHGVSQTRLTNLLKYPLEFDPRGDGRRSKRIAEECRETWPQLVPTDQLIELERWVGFMGFALGELTWSFTSKRWTPTLRVWHATWITWRWDTNSYWVTALEGYIEVKPGDGRWVLFAPYGMRRGWIWGKARALAVPWLIRQWNWRDWARYSEVYSTPGRIAEMPASATEESKQKYLRSVAAMGTETVVRAEYGADGQPKWNVKLLEAMSTGWEGFRGLQQSADTAIAVVWLGQNLTTEGGSATGGGGSRAQAQVHDRVRDDLTEWDATVLPPFLQQQVLAPWCLYNFGDRDLAPLPRWEVKPPDDLEKKSKTLVQVSASLANMSNAGAGDALDLPGLLDEYEIPRKEMDEDEAPEQIEPLLEPGVPQPQLDPHSPVFLPEGVDIGQPPSSRVRLLEKFKAANLALLLDAGVPEADARAALKKLRLPKKHERPSMGYTDDHKGQPQSYVISKKKAKSAGQAKRIAKKFGAKIGKVEETETSYRFRQASPSGFDSFKAAKVAPGVTIIYGQPKQRKRGKAQSRLELERSIRSAQGKRLQAAGYMELDQAAGAFSCGNCRFSTRDGFCDNARIEAPVSLGHGCCNLFQPRATRPSWPPPKE